MEQYKSFVAYSLANFGKKRGKGVASPPIKSTPVSFVLSFGVGFVEIWYD
jgi:hypothetical protein